MLVGDLSDKASGKYDIITANIVANAILSLAPAVPGLMAEGATFIASGIIDSRKDEVIAGLEKAGLAWWKSRKSAAGSASSARKRKEILCRTVILPPRSLTAPPPCAGPMPTILPA